MFMAMLATEIFSESIVTKCTPIGNGKQSDLNENGFNLLSLGIKKKNTQTNGIRKRKQKLNLNNLNKNRTCFKSF